MPNNESKLQAACVRWFNIAYPRYKLLLFAVPNGAYLSGDKLQRIKQWNRLKSEGAVAGVSDLILLIPNEQFNGLCIEMKTTAKHSKQSSAQKKFEEAVIAQGYQYKIIRNINSFKNLIENYLKSKNNDRKQL